MVDASIGDPDAAGNRGRSAGRLQLQCVVLGRATAPGAPAGRGLAHPYGLCPASGPPRRPDPRRRYAGTALRAGSGSREAAAYRLAIRSLRERVPRNRPRQEPEHPPDAPWHQPGRPRTRKTADQLERLSACNIDFRFGSDRSAVVVNERLVEAFQYVGGEDPRTRRHARWIERIVLSEAFFRELLRHPYSWTVRQSKTSSPRPARSTFICGWRSGCTLEAEATVSWPALWRQFGREFRTLKSFRSEFQEPLALALAVYRAARVQVVERGLLLSPSPPPIRR